MKDSNYDGSNELTQANTDSSSIMVPASAGILADGDDLGPHGDTYISAISTSELWFAVYDQAEIARCLVEQEAICFLYRETQFRFLDVIPLSSEVLYTAALMDRKLHAVVSNGLWRVVFDPSDVPQERIVPRRSRDGKPFGVTAKGAELGIGMIKHPVPLERWYGVDRLVDGRWLPTNSISLLALVSQHQATHRADSAVDALNDRLAKRESDIGSLCRQLQSAEQEREADIRRHDKQLALAQSQCALARSDGEALIRAMERLTADDCLLNEGMDLQRRLETEQLERAIAEETAVKAQRQTEDHQRYVKYLQDLMRRNHLSFNQVIGHNPDNGKAA